ncbi:unnamed protein product [Ranitomeya imitator]|uniref:Uncharacterized protein n=1 Tax=Ranitomeya imitator TaxID=111125 RepID=A0ABN9M1I4_9NEOB|nr:unnamed protein product [Ranitomeya imitator]
MARRKGFYVPNQLMNESQVSLTFLDWLASVTERIHQTMHFQFDGKPEPLVFHIPQSFFDALSQRLSMGNVRMRLPNCTTGFISKRKKNGLKFQTEKGILKSKFAVPAM